MSKVYDSGRVIIGIYVDDLLIAAETEGAQEECINEIRKDFPDIKVNKGTHLSFLGLDIHQNREDGSIRISQPGYVEEILIGRKGSAETPATASLIAKHDASPRAPDQKQFLSDVMKLMYLALHSRPDILFATSILSSRTAAPTIRDNEHLNRIFDYLNSTKEMALTLRPKDTQLRVSVDASYGIHRDKKSHSGMVFSMGGCTFACRSKKQTYVANSSTAAELNALSDSMPAIIGMVEMLDVIGYPQGPVKVQQDNTSTVQISEKGYSTSKNGQHLAIRAAFVKEQIDREIVELVKTPSASMTADVLTKPITKNSFFEQRSKLLNHEPP
jgi:hypothetical protein